MRPAANKNVYLWLTVEEMRAFTAFTLHKKMKFSFKNFLSKCDQIRSLLRVCSHLLKKSLMENFILCAVLPINI